MSERVEKTKTESAEENQVEKGGVEKDAYLSYVTGEYQKYRSIAWALAVIALSIILIGIAVEVSGAVEIKIFNLIMSVGNLFVVIWALVVFMQVRPLKKRVKQYKGTPLHTIIDESAEDGVRIEDTGKMRDTNDMYKILERKVRTEVIPDRPEYDRLRKRWLVIMAAAALVVVLACVFYVLAPKFEVLAVLLVLAGFILVIVGFYVDRTQMKPMRDEFVGQFGMNEMTYRDNMH